MLFSPPLCFTQSTFPAFSDCPTCSYHLRNSHIYQSDKRHLPATLVASFIKRISRHSMSAPPHGIVAIIPVVYNLLKRHPTCMQLIHRPDSLPGRPDPYDDQEPDPMRTRALESSLWELAVPTFPFHFPLYPSYPRAFPPPLSHGLLM